MVHQKMTNGLTFLVKIFESRAGNTDEIKQTLRNLTAYYRSRLNTIQILYKVTTINVKLLGEPNNVLLSDDKIYFIIK